MAICRTSNNQLGELSFIGGDHKTINVRLSDLDNGGYIKNSNATVTFSIVEFSNRFGTPNLTLVCEPSSVDEEVFILELTSDDTKGMHGKYIYQLTAELPNGKTESFQGVAIIEKNINAN